MLSVSSKNFSGVLKVDDGSAFNKQISEFVSNWITFTGLTLTLLWVNGVNSLSGTSIETMCKFFAVG